MDPYVPLHAGAGRRFINFLVDYIAFFSLAVVIMILVAMIFGDEVLGAISEGFPSYLFGWLAYFSYYVFCEGLWGRTLGKLITGTVVVDDRGGKPSFGQVLGRSAARFIPFEAFSVLFAENSRGWHDSLAKTHVVQVRGVPAQKALHGDSARASGSDRT